MRTYSHAARCSFRERTASWKLASSAVGLTPLNCSPLDCSRQRRRYRTDGRPAASLDKGVVQFEENCDRNPECPGDPRAKSRCARRAPAGQ